MKIVGYHKHSKRLEKIVDRFLKGARIHGHTTELYEMPRSARKSGVVDIPKADLYVLCGWYGVRKVLEKSKVIGNNKLIISDTYIRAMDYKPIKVKKCDNSAYLCISNMLGCVGSKYKKLSTNRWKFIKKSNKINVLPWKTKGDLVLITYASDGIYLNHKRNIRAFVKCIKACNERGLKVVVCSHPREVRRNERYGIASKIKEFKGLGCTFDVGADKYLEDALSVIGYAGSMAFKSTVLGIPFFPVLNCYISNLYEDYDMSNIDNFLDNIPRPDRSKWFNWIAHQQWTYNEIDEGMAWKFLIEDKNMEFKEDINKKPEMR